MSASIWAPGSTNIPVVDPRSQIKSEIFTALDGQTLFTLNTFTYTPNNGALDVYANGVKLPGNSVTESSSTTFSIPPCDAGDLVEAVGNTAISDAEGAAAAAEAAAVTATAAATTATAAEASASSSAAIASSASATASAAAAIAAAHVPLNWRGAWATATAYAVNDAFKYNGSSYVVVVAHTSTTVSGDTLSGNIDVIAQRGDPGAGTGDLVSTNNLSDVANIVTARNNLGAAAATHNHAGVYEPVDATILRSANIGSTVQAYDAATAKTNIAQNFTAPQRSALLVDNDGNFDLSAKQNFKCTAAGNLTITFSNLSDGLAGSVVLINSSGYTMSKAASVKMSASALTRISTAGTYRIDYISDGTNVYCTASENIA